MCIYDGFGEHNTRIVVGGDRPHARFGGMIPNAILLGSEYFPWASFGDKGQSRCAGVRLEDDVLVTETGIENLTVLPSTVEEIEPRASRSFPFLHEGRWARLALHLQE